MQNNQSVSNFTNNQSISNFTNNQGAPNKQKITNKNIFLLTVSHVKEVRRNMMPIPKSVHKSIDKENIAIIKMFKEDLQYSCTISLITGIKQEDFHELVSRIVENTILAKQRDDYKSKSLMHQNNKLDHFLLDDSFVECDTKICAGASMFINYINNMQHFNKLYSITKQVNLKINSYLKNENFVTFSNIAQEVDCKIVDHVPPSLSFNEKYPISQSTKKFFYDTRSFFYDKDITDVSKTKIIIGKHIVYTLSELTNKSSLISGLYSIGSNNYFMYNHEKYSKAHEFKMFYQLDNKVILSFSFLLNKAVFDFKYMDSKILIVNFSPIKNNDLNDLFENKNNDFVEYKSTYRVIFRLPQNKNEIKKFFHSFIIFQEVTDEINKHYLTLNYASYAKAHNADPSILIHNINLGFNCDLQMIKRNINNDKLYKLSSRQHQLDELSKMFKIFLNATISKKLIVNIHEFSDIITIKHIKTEINLELENVSTETKDLDLYSDEVSLERENDNEINNGLNHETTCEMIDDQYENTKSINPKEIEFVQSEYYNIPNIKKWEQGQLIAEIKTLGHGHTYYCEDSVNYD